MPHSDGLKLTVVSHRFQDTQAGVVFGSLQLCRWRCAEVAAWPEEDLFLDPASFIGSAGAVAAFLDKVC